MAKKLISVFGLAFFLNWLWEILHSQLYLHYRGQDITPAVLLRAAIVDAALITVLVFIAQKYSKKKSLFVILTGLVLAVAIEKWALAAGRWAYGAAMPVIPILQVGLTPTIQLAATGYITQKLASINREKNAF